MDLLAETVNFNFPSATLSGGIVNPMRNLFWTLGTFGSMLVCGAAAVWLAICVLAPLTQNVEGPFEFFGLIILGSGIIGALAPAIAIAYLRKGGSPWRFDIRTIFTITLLIALLLGLVCYAVR